MTPTDWHHYDTFWRKALLDELTWSLTLPEFNTWLISPEELPTPIWMGYE